MATEDNNDNDDEDSLDDDSLLSNSTLLPHFNALHSGDNTTATSSAISTLHQDEMKFLAAKGTKEQLISAYPGEKHLINHLLLSRLSLETIATAILAKEVKSATPDHI
eukprot:6798641-Ditylum_brightwellii.AAC.1